MRKFEREIASAKRCHRMVLSISLAALALVVLGTFSVILVANGTKVEIKPADANAAGRIAVKQGAAVAVNRVIYGLANTAVVIVSAPGFLDKELTITENQAGRAVEVELQERPALLSASVTPGEPGTSWLIDGTVEASGPRFERELAPGVYELAVDHPHHDLFRQKLELGRAETRNLEVELRRIEGRLRIDATIQAAVYADDVLLGKTPLDRGLAGGKHDIRVEADGYRPVSETVEISRAAPVVERRYQLEPLAAFLTVNTRPSGGVLLINGGEAAAGERLEVPSQREQRISYVKEGYRGERAKVTLSPGERRSVSITLEPELGWVEFQVGAEEEVFVNGRSIGKGFMRERRRAVDLKVEVRRPGHQTIRREIRPSPKRTVVVRGGLKTLKAAALAAAKPVYTNQAGQDMRLYRPSEVFSMGAPRSEKGQRANEFIRKVKLDRAFYAALHETTNDAFKTFRKEHGVSDNLPVRSVSWPDAAAFCNWLSRKSGLPPFYRVSGGQVTGFDPNSNGYRLLSEAEWEWLARKAGRAKQTVFPWGDKDVVPEKAGNIADEAANGVAAVYVPRYNDGFEGPAPVGSFKKEKSGLYDLFGNVSEWVHDAYVLAPPAPGTVETNPMKQVSGPIHVIKGSSFRSGARTALRSSYRDGLEGARADVGFRVGRYLYPEVKGNE